MGRPMSSRSVTDRIKSERRVRQQHDLSHKGQGCLRSHYPYLPVESRRLPLDSQHDDFAAALVLFLFS